MTDLNDLKLDKWQGSLEPEPRNRGWLIAVGLLLAIGLAGAGYYYYSRRSAPPATEVRNATEQAVAPAPAPSKPLPEAGETIDLPPIDQTDAIVRELVGQLSSHPTIAAWLTTDHLLRNFTVALENISNGRTPAAQLAKIRPVGPFLVKDDGGHLSIDPRSYRRYDRYADAVAALDARGTARLYATLKPRIVDAYRELGHPDGNVDQAVEKAIIELLKTPLVEGDVALASKSVAYEFKDSRLQSLSPIQRQFLRMGPRNVRLIQAKLREIAPYLGIAAESLPK
jgi:hypothetical protein